MQQQIINWKNYFFLNAVKQQACYVSVMHAHKKTHAYVQAHGNSAAVGDSYSTKSLKSLKFSEKSIVKTIFFFFFKNHQKHLQ